MNRRGVNLARGTFAPDVFWVGSLNLLSSLATIGRRNPQNGVKLLYPWLCLLPEHLHASILCDMALYASWAHQHEQAELFLKRARQTIQRASDQSAAADRYFRMTCARVLLSGGKPVEALDWLPPLVQTGEQRIHELLIRTEISLAAGDRGSAARDLCEAKELSTCLTLPRHGSRLEQLALQL